MLRGHIVSSALSFQTRGVDTHSLCLQVGRVAKATCWSKDSNLKNGYLQEDSNEKNLYFGIKLWTCLIFWHEAICSQVHFIRNMQHTSLPNKPIQRWRPLRTGFCLAKYKCTVHKIDLISLHCDHHDVVDAA